MYPNGLIDSGFNLSGEPEFVNLLIPFGEDRIPVTSDDGLMLATHSPCIDRGSASFFPRKDIFGTSRPQGNAPDLGAYEFASFSTTLTENNSSHTINNIFVAPNPFNPSVTIKIRAHFRDNLSVTIINGCGIKISSLVGVSSIEGTNFLWNGKDYLNKNVPSGIYLARVETNKKIHTARLILVR
jgi:hypothetical protein